MSSQVGVTASAVDLLERDFDDVIREMGGEDNLERFRLEYEKLHRALKKSHESERKLIKKCQELSQEIMANAAKIQSALKLSQEDQNTIEALKKEIEKAWKMVDGAHEKEARAKETIQKLKKEAADLSAIVEKGASLTHGQEVSLAELTEANKELTKERDSLNTRITQQLHELKEQTEKQRRLDVDVAAKDEDLQKVTEKLTHLRRDFDREVKSKERADGQVRELMQVLQARNSEYDTRTTTLAQKTKAVEELDAHIKDENLKKAQLAADYEKTVRKLEENRKYMESEQDSFTRSQEQLDSISRQIKETEDQIAGLRYEEQKVQKSKDQRLKLLKKVTQERDDVKKTHEMLIRHISQLERQVQVLEREAVEREEELVGVGHDEEVVKKRAGLEVDKQKSIKTDIGSIEDRRHELEEELELQKKIAGESRREIAELETQREQFAEMASEAGVKYQEAVEELKIANMQHSDYLKQIDDATRKLQSQQAKYEQVRSERNLYSKNLIEAQDQISEMRQKFKIMDHQIDQLKEELSMKEKKHFEAVTNYKVMNEKLAKERKKINLFMEKYKDEKSRSESLTQEIRQLTKVINRCDAELSEQQQHFLTVTNERDILGTQLIRRNDELALLYEKVRIQQATLSRGEVQYRDRLVDIRMLRLKITELKRNVHMAQVRLKNAEELKSQTIALTRQLALEKTKVHALSEELENPQNFIRWRKLEGSDLKPDEKVQKIQALQKRLIAKTEQCVEHDLLIQEKDKLYVELHAILSRQPGPEVAEQLNIYQQDLRHRNALMKSRAAELNMSASQAAEFKYEIERLHREVQEVKKQYFEMKMNNQVLVKERLSRTAGGASATLGAS